MENLNHLINFSYEDLARALYLKGDNEGFHKVTDKTKWREPVMAAKLGHIAHKKISAGAGTDEYGSDAYDPKTKRMAEYKSNAIDDKETRNLLQKMRNKNTKFAALNVSGVYNGAYTIDAIEKYAKNDHYFGIFYQERCVLIIKVDTDFVKSQLLETYNKKELLRQSGKKVTTNLNTVKVNLISDREDYEVAYADENWFSENDGDVSYLGL